MGILDFIFGKDANENRPIMCEGYTINYDDPYWDPCPYHHCTTYQTVEDNRYCYCPKCNRLLHHYVDYPQIL